MARDIDRKGVMGMIDLMLAKRDKRNGMRPIRPLCCMLVWWVYGLKGESKQIGLGGLEVGN